MYQSDISICNFKFTALSYLSTIPGVCVEKYVLKLNNLICTRYTAISINNSYLKALNGKRKKL